MTFSMPVKFAERMSKISLGLTFHALGRLTRVVAVVLQMLQASLRPEVQVTGTISGAASVIWKQIY